jgi:hypothetical protein
VRCKALARLTLGVPEQRQRIVDVRQVEEGAAGSLRGEDDEHHHQSGHCRLGVMKSVVLRALYMRLITLSDYGKFV